MNKWFIFWGICVVLLIGVFFFTGEDSNQYDEVAKCITDSGAKMYGAYWCPHCQEQKKMFGNSFKHINYIECSVPNGRAQTKECSDAGIEGYPTWEFGDSTRISGKQQIETLARLSGCDFNEN